jgi:anthraniloyl-CoA monooxygenase
MQPWQFGFHFFSRSISAEKMRVRDPQFVEAMLHAWKAEHNADPIDTRLQIAHESLDRRLLKVIKHSNHIAQITDGRTVLSAADGDPAVPLIAAPSITGTTVDSSFLAELDALCETRPSAAVVHSGTELSRVLCSEHIRFTHNIPTIVIDDPAAVRSRRAVDEVDAATTLILSGRADAVAYDNGAHITSPTPAAEINQ